MSNLILVDKPAALLHISSRYTGYHKYLLPGQAQIRVLTLPGMRSSASRPSDDEPKPRRSPIGGSRPIVLVACQSLILHENLIGTLPDIVTVMPAQDREWLVKGGDRGIGDRSGAWDETWEQKGWQTNDRKQFLNLLAAPSPAP